MMVVLKTLDLYLTTVQVSKESLQGLKRNGSLKSVTQNIQSDTKARVTTIALPELSFRQAKKEVSTVVSLRKHGRDIGVPMHLHVLLNIFIRL